MREAPRLCRNQPAWCTLAGGCLWGVRAFVRTLPGVTATEAGRANRTSRTLDGEYDGYAECVRTEFDPGAVTVGELVAYLFEIIDPYSLNRQGDDVGRGTTRASTPRTRATSNRRGRSSPRGDADRVAVEVLPLVNYVRSAEEHQDRLDRCPDDYCHIPTELLTKYRT